jgi:flavin-binding protein dodecin
MSNSTYKKIELVGTSDVSYAKATENALARATETLHGIGWFEVTELRGRVEDGKVAEFQVTLKVGMKLD